jgi:hypothetical protein
MPSAPPCRKGAGNSHAWTHERSGKNAGGDRTVTLTDDTKALAPWTETLPADWKVTRIDALADVLFSNVDKHTIEGEQAVRLCNYVDVYNNERITVSLDFMEASAVRGGT